MSHSKSVVVAGGGVIGLCTAWYALQKGHQVTLLERRPPDHDGCSLGNAGMIVPSHFTPLAAPGMVSLGLKMMFQPRSPFYVRPRLSRELARWGLQFMRSANAAHVTRSAPLLRDLNMGSRSEYESLAEQFGDRFGLTRRGLLMLCKTDEMRREESHAAEKARELGIPAEALTPEAAARLDPGIRMDVAGAIYYPNDCHLTPQKFVVMLRQELQKSGAKVCYGVEATGLRAKNGRVVSLETATEGRAGVLEADEYVVAGGAWSPQLAGSLGIDLPLQAGKGYSVTLPAPPHQPQLCSILTEARVAVTPMGETLRFGGTMEIAGLDETINRSRVDGIFNSIPRYFPDYRVEDFGGLPVWSGLRPCSPDGLPYIGRFSAYANLSAATGHAMMGLSLAPITGRLMSEILSDEAPSIPLELLKPDRFG